MNPNAWLTTFACLTLAISLPGAIARARSAVLALRRFRRSPDDRMARFEYGWKGAFALQFGLATCMSTAVLLDLHAGSSWPGIAGLLIVNLLVQPVAVLLCWIGVRKVTLGLIGRVSYAWRRVPESELAGLLPSERRGLAWFCVFQGMIILAWGAAMGASCAWLLVRAFLADSAPSP